MEGMGFGKEYTHNVMAVACGLLFASNLEFLKVTDDISKLADSNFLQSVLSLLGVTQEALNDALCTFSIKAGKERHVRSLPKYKAENSLKGLIKATYGALFTSLVSTINKAITVREDEPPVKSKVKIRRRSSLVLGKAAIVGVLDIFGFESFKKSKYFGLLLSSVTAVSMLLYASLHYDGALTTCLIFNLVTTCRFV